MFRKSPIALLLSVLLLLTVAAPAMTGGSDAAFEPYAETLQLNIAQAVDSTYTFPEGMDYENNGILNAAEAALNIDVKDAWQAQSGADYDQKVNLSIASNDLPDGLTVNYTQFSSMVKFGMLADLTQAYADYASPTMYSLLTEKGEGRALDVATFDGKLYGLPNQPVSDDDYCLVWIRKDWLDKLSLEPPTTVDDLRAIAQEFIDKDPGGNGAGNTIGILGPDSTTEHPTFNFLQPGNSAHRLDVIFTAFGAFPGFWLQGDDGAPVYGTLLPETRTALEYLAALYKDGLLDPQIGVRKSSNEALIAGQAGIWFGPWWAGYFPLPDAIAQNPEADWHSYMLTDVNGKVTSHMQSVCNTFSVIRKDYSNPEVVIKLNSVLLRDEHSYDVTTFTMGMYPLRVALAPVDEMQVTRDAIKAVYSGEKTADDFADASYDPYKLLRGDVRDILTTKKGSFDDLSIGQWDTKSPAWARLYSIVVGTNPFYTTEVNRVYSLIYTQTPVIEAKYATLQKMEDEMIMRIIVGQADITEFDAFCQKWLAEGGAEITADVAAAIAG
ncbi:MAG: extracellular solute-binding protein [Clostridiales bacterium]|nr:extracellular solute-binding protein [Clostridiales bacterium]